VADGGGVKRKDVVLHVAAMLLVGGDLAFLRALPSSYMTATLSRMAWTGLALVAVAFRAHRNTRQDGQKARHV
jgi:hypothetical protein